MRVVWRRGVGRSEVGRCGEEGEWRGVVGVEVRAMTKEVVVGCDVWVGASGCAGVGGGVGHG